MIFSRISVRLRLALAHAIGMAVIYLMIGFGMYRLVEHNLDESVNVALVSSAKAIRDARFSLDSASVHSALIDKFFHDPMLIEQFMGERFIKPYARIISPTGKEHSRTGNIIASLPVTPNAVARAEVGESTIETFDLRDSAPLRQITLPVMLAGEFTGEIIQVGVFLNHTLDTLRGTLLVLCIVLPLTLLVSILLGYILTARALKPVRAVSIAASRIYIDDLSIRLPIPAADDEIQNLSKTFNQMFDRLEDAVKRLRRFTADVSHELRTPLAVIRGEAELALRRERSETDYRTAIGKIAKESVHMSTIVEDLLLLARAESQNIAITFTVIETRAFISGVSQKVAQIFETKDVHLEVSNDAKVNLKCSPTYLSLAVKNILHNAANHSSPGQRVIFKAWNTSESIYFSISDFGEGIAAEVIDHIFDPFFRADSARGRQSGGAGIGLSLALALIKLHGGIIKVDSQPGEGSCFTVELPQN